LTSYSLPDSKKAQTGKAEGEENDLQDGNIQQDISSSQISRQDGCWEIFAPPDHTTPLICNSPHSGRDYSSEFVTGSILDAVALRRSEDAYVDELFAATPEYGAHLVKALFPRAYVDANREPFELDPKMFSDSLPSYVNSRSHRAAGGLGTVARIVSDGNNIYADKIPYAEAKHRIRTYYKPYHVALAELIQQTRQKFGGALVLDCHSMPSSIDDEKPAKNGSGGGVNGRKSAGQEQSGDINIVLGDRNGASCALEITNIAYDLLREMGYGVALNNPYSGGFNTQHYGRPAHHIHVLQIEICRSLYMDEHNVERGPGIGKLQQDMTELVSALADISPAVLQHSDEPPQAPILPPFIPE